MELLSSLVYLKNPSLTLWCPCPGHSWKKQEAPRIGTFLREHSARRAGGPAYSLCFKELPSLPAAHQKTDKCRTCLHLSGPANSGSVRGAFMAQSPSSKTRVLLSLLSHPWASRDNPPGFASALPRPLSRLSSNLNPTLPTTTTTTPPLATVSGPIF